MENRPSDPPICNQCSKPIRMPKWGADNRGLCSCSPMPFDPKTVGLYKKYEVKKISNPKKFIDSIVLEFDDPIARVGIKAWADEMGKQGFVFCADMTRAKLKKIEKTKL